MLSGMHVIYLFMHACYIFIPAHVMILLCILYIIYYVDGGASDDPDCAEDGEGYVWC